MNYLKQAWDKGVFNKSLLFINVIIIVIVIIACGTIMGLYVGHAR